MKLQVSVRQKLGSQGYRPTGGPALGRCRGHHATTAAACLQWDRLLGLVRFASRDDSLRFGYMVNTSPTWDAARCLPARAAREWLGPTEFSRIFLTSPAV